MKTSAIFISMVWIVSAQTFFNCDTEPSSCGDTLECDQCGDCYVSCNAPGACAGKTLSCPLDHVCSVDCGYDQFSGDKPDSINACAGMTINNPTAPRAGSASCLPDGVTYAGFGAQCGAPGSCANITLNNYCADTNCAFYACDTYSPNPEADCPDELGGLGEGVLGVVDAHAHVELKEDVAC